MPAPRAVLAVVPFVFITVACRVATQQNELYEGDQISESAQASRPGPSRTASAELDASIVEASDDAMPDADAAAEAETSVPPPCTVQNMHPSAPTTTCSIESFSITGGTLPLGNFYLTRWTDELKCSNPYPQRKATMSLEAIGGKTFMRWVSSLDGNVTWGTYELTRLSPTAFARTEVCNSTPQTRPAPVSYTASANDVLFRRDDGAIEKWIRVPKATPDTPPDIEPIFN
jgi:hypothetical protein